MQSVLTLSSQINQFLLSFQDKHFTLRKKHDQLKNGYNDFIENNKYYYVRDIPTFFKAKDAYDDEFMKVLSAGATIAGIDSKVRLVKAELMTYELLHSKSLDESAISMYMERLNKCNDEATNLDTLYDRLNREFENQVAIFLDVTQRKTN